MSNRQRLMATLVMQQLRGATAQNVYLMEQTTSLYRWVAGHFREHVITGSEYLGEGYRGGETVEAWRYHTPLRMDALLHTARHKASLFYAMLRMGGVRHEDVTNLSFETGSLDLIVSNDVFEHVPDPNKAFAECARVLRPGGVMLVSIPFHNGSDDSVIRAEWAQAGPRHLLSPVYHGNPVSAEGSLVFTDFGWDVIQSFQAAGFSDATIEMYASAEFGHLGGGQLVFRVTR
jgi:SAM-dependent methyltransferase